MAGIGPALPPHILAKRKRQEEEEGSKDEAATASGANSSRSPEGPDKRRRPVGPAMPPAPLDERPSEPANADSSDESEDDNDFGPALPTAGVTTTTASATDNNSSAGQEAPPESKPKRDDWMMMPPKQDDLAARLDPSKQRARGFNTGKSARAAGLAHDEDSSAWHETAEQKQKRLADEMMGVTKAAPIGPSRPQTAREDAVAAAKIREHTEKTRGPSLLEQHRVHGGAAAQDDDPSARAFDREKDIGGAQIGNAQRSELLRRAGDFSSRFARGSYL